MSTPLGGPMGLAAMVRRAVVVGGGLAGLVAAWDLHRDGWAVTVLEASPRWGGKLYTSAVGDRMVDAGPDSMLARVDAGRQLCEELGLADRLVHPRSAIGALLFLDGHLQPLPPTVLGVPIDLDRLDPVISAEGRSKAKVDLESGWEWPDHDPSVGEVCRTRLGDEITERLVDPLLGGINASDIDHLSLRSAAPLLASALDQEGSLIRGLAARAKANAALGAAKTPVFYGIDGGIAVVVDALVEELADADLRLNTPITSVQDALETVKQPVDAVVLATPAFASSQILADTAPRAAEALQTIDYASVAQVTIELPIDGVQSVLDTSGILFPRAGGTLLTACTWFSSKWDHYHHPDRVLLRLTSGRYLDDRINGLDDDGLTSTLIGELSDAIGPIGTPLARRVHRWHRSLPQYSPGHAARVDTARAGVDEARMGEPAISLIGATYDGIGIPAVITGARRATGELIKIGADD